MQVAIVVYPGFTALDVVGPSQVFSTLPNLDVALVAERVEPLRDDNNSLTLLPDRTFADTPAPDVVLVPGGLINARRQARSGGALVDWLVAVHPGTRWTASVCTGALLLGAAGILDGRRATTHWFARDELVAFGAQVSEELVVIDDKVATAGGVSAGVELALLLVSDIAGQQAAEAVQLAIGYNPKSPFDAGTPQTAPGVVLGMVRGLIMKTIADGEAEADARESSAQQSSAQESSIKESSAPASSGSDTRAETQGVAMETVTR